MVGIIKVIKSDQRVRGQLKTVVLWQTLEWNFQKKLFYWRLSQNQGKWRVKLGLIVNIRLLVILIWMEDCLQIWIWSCASHCISTLCNMTISSSHQDREAVSLPPVLVGLGLLLKASLWSPNPRPKEASISPHSCGIPQTHHWHSWAQLRLEELSRYFIHLWTIVNAYYLKPLNSGVVWTRNRA